MAAAVQPRSGQATVTLNDGTVATYDTDRPIYLYRLSQVYDVGDEDANAAKNIQRGMMIVWVAAGMPHSNGDQSQAAAVAAMEQWLEEDVAAISRDGGSDNPPANRQQRRSRKSRA